MKKIKAIKVLGGDIFEQNMLDLINPITSKPFSTIVIAGENGTGKTIFLNRLGYQETNSQKSVESFILE
jgi:archaellum biogenesis ATPase FlaH